MQTLPLRERSRHMVRLSPADVAHLRTLPRRWFRLERLHGSRRYLLTVGGIAGVLLLPTVRLEIAPKVHQATLLALLDVEAPPPTEADASGTPASGALLDLIARAFVHHLTARVRAGLHQDYQEQTLAAPILQGRLDVATQIREGHARPEVLHQTRDVRSPDLPCNQLIRSALEALLTTPGLAPSVRQELTALGPALAEVSPLPSHAWGLPLNAPRAYAPLLDTARLVLGGLPARHGATPGVAYVLELERLFERFVIRGLESVAGPGRLIEPQARRILRGANGPALVVKPDALVHQAGRMVQVVDAKWKRLRHGRPSRADLYQILAYAETLDIPRATLIYPGRHNRCNRYPLTRRGTAVTVWTVRCEAGADAFADVLD